MVETIDTTAGGQALPMLRQHMQPDYLLTASMACLILASALLPFELKKPLFRIGPLGITNSEIAIYLAVCLWATGRLLGRWGRWTAVHTSVALLGTATLAAALWAPAHRADAIKFALRGFGGYALFAAVADLVYATDSAAKIGVALLAGSCLSAAAAGAERWWPAASEFLMIFKTQPSMVGSYLRASGTFQYVNIASMYWEATLPLAMTIPLWGQREQRVPIWIWTGVGSSLLLVEAILLGASRAGILIAILVLLATLCFSRTFIDSLRAPAILSLMALVALIFFQLATDDLIGLRLTTTDPSTWYRAGFQGFPSEFKTEAKTLIRVPLTVHNLGRLRWHAKGEQSIAVSYHWLSSEGNDVLIWDGVQSEILHDVDPGATVQLEAWIMAPPQPGDYTLQWDMVQKNVAWFSIYGGEKAQARVTVQGSAPAEAANETPTRTHLPLLSQPSRSDLWRVALHMWRERPFLGVGPDNFRRKYGAYLGLQNPDERIYANSLYLEVLATTGLIGTLALGAVLIALAFQIRKSWLSANNGAEKLLLVGIGLGLATYCTHGVLDYFLPFTPTYGLFWILSGMAAGLPHSESAK